MSTNSDTYFHSVDTISVEVNNSIRLSMVNFCAAHKPVLSFAIAWCIASSIVFLMTNRCTYVFLLFKWKKTKLSIEFRMNGWFIWTYLVWPIRCIRPIACSSSPGLSMGSTKMTWVASVKLRPFEPYWMGSNKHVTPNFGFYNTKTKPI